MAEQPILNDEVLQGVSVDLRVCVGSAKPTIKELMEMAPDTVLALNSGVDDPVELFVGDKLLAKGFLEASEEDGNSTLSVRLTSVGDPAKSLE